MGPVSAFSGVSPKPITKRSTSGASYVRRSENSSARTKVTPVDMVENSSGNFSLMPPGAMPVPCRVTPPSKAAARSGAASLSPG